MAVTFAFEIAAEFSLSPRRGVKGGRQIPSKEFAKILEDFWPPGAPPQL
ncbi:hypothetical protein [Pseudogemmobacter humi]|nr:hypothetical protein [Pseudogemmobacter humi]